MFLIDWFVTVLLCFVDKYLIVNKQILRKVEM